MVLRNFFRHLQLTNTSYALFGLTDPWPPSKKTLENCHRGIFNFKHAILRLDALPQYMGEAVPFIETFSFLSSFSTIGDHHFRKLGRMCLENWIKNTKPNRWTIETTVKRLKNWLYTFNFFTSSAPEAFRILLEKSFQEQLRFLQKKMTTLKNQEHYHSILQILCLTNFYNNKTKDALLYLEKIYELCCHEFFTDGGHVSGTFSKHYHHVYTLTELLLHLKDFQHPLYEKLNNLLKKIGPTLRLFSGIQYIVPKDITPPFFDPHVYQRLLSYQGPLESIHICKDMGYARVLLSKFTPCLIKFRPSQTDEHGPTSSHKLFLQLPDPYDWIDQHIHFQTPYGEDMYDHSTEEPHIDVNISVENEGHTLFDIQYQSILKEAHTYDKRKKTVALTINRCIHIDHTTGMVRGIDTITVDHSLLFLYKMMIPQKSTILKKDQSMLINFNQRQNQLKIQYDGHANFQHQRLHQGDLLVFSKSLQANTNYTFRWAMQVQSA